MPLPQKNDYISREYSSEPVQLYFHTGTELGKEKQSKDAHTFKKLKVDRLNNSNSSSCTCLRARVIARIAPLPFICGWVM